MIPARSDQAAEVASGLNAPASVYVLDFCEADGDLRLIDLNPFGSADLYDCDAEAVVRAVSRIGASRSRHSSCRHASKRLVVIGGKDIVGERDGVSQTTSTMGLQERQRPEAM